MEACAGGGGVIWLCGCYSPLRSFQRRLAPPRHVTGCNNHSFVEQLQSLTQVLSPSPQRCAVRDRMLQQLILHTSCVQGDQPRYERASSRAVLQRWASTYCSAFGLQQQLTNQPCVPLQLTLRWWVGKVGGGRAVGKVGGGVGKVEVGVARWEWG